MFGTPLHQASSRARATGFDAFLRKKFFKGKLHATDVAEGAESMHATCPSECPKFIQQLGACNKTERNQYRKVMKAFDRHCELPPTYQAYLTGRDRKHNKQQIMLTSFILPHELLNYYITE